jgi:hypothetical protein
MQLGPLLQLGLTLPSVPLPRLLPITTFLWQEMHAQALGFDSLKQERPIEQGPWVTITIITITIVLLPVTMPMA